MGAVVRVALFAGMLAVGSWVGLGKPTLARGRVMVDGAVAKAVARVNAEVGADAKADAKADADENADENADEDERADAADAEAKGNVGEELARSPSIRAWPALNDDASITKAWMVAEGPAYAAGSGRRLVTLTFDDGPFPETTPTVLKILARHHIHATFFVIGRYLDGESGRARRSRAVLAQVAAAGHLVGNHTYDHALLSAVTHTQVLEQIDRGQAAIERAIGKRPILFRPPFGRLDDFGRAAVRERGLELLLWSVEKQDMVRADSHEMFRELVSQIKYKEGGVVLLHDIRKTSIDALRELIAWLRDHRWNPNKPERLGYEIVDLPTYLRAVAAAPLPYASRDDLEKVRREKEAARGTSRPETVSRRRKHERRAALTPVTAVAHDDFADSD